MALPTATPFDGQVWPNDKPVVTYNAALGQWIPLHPTIPSRFVLTKYKGGTSSDRTPQLGGTVVASVSEQLFASRTYYVRTDGSDSNTGLLDTAGGAFKTIQHAVNVCAGLDTTLYTATIRCGSGTGSGESLSLQGLGLGIQDTGYPIVLIGDTATPANVTVSSIYCFGSAFKVSGIKSSGDITSDFAYLALDHCTANRYIAVPNGELIVNAGCTAGGNADAAVQAIAAGSYVGVNAAIAVSGTPAYTSGFALASSCALIEFFAPPTGAATGPRYLATLNSVINTFGGGASYLPGNAVGATGTGGQYG